MAVIRTTANMIIKRLLHHPPLSFFSPLSQARSTFLYLRSQNADLGFKSTNRRICFGSIRCAASDSGGDKKVSSRLSQVHQLLQEAEERASSAGNEPPPKITIDHVTVSFARSGGPGGQNVNKVNTKVDMRFNVRDAYWLSDRIKEKIMQTEKNRINKDGELVISSTKTRTQNQLSNVYQLKQAIIDAASYVPPPPSEEQKKKIAKMAALGEQRRLKSKKALSDKKSFRRSRDSWD
ncbi:peptidyl-tRNA hydrolase ICT1 mitochondrial isoform X1 [Tripterygium wilfordii]|uniref:Peptidyl-tRNA hydrolase ICT1 mitochondrial isoform X1 n=1 Tax=Tripterygium wilfordii TaxID=458696 RepID=A0A7J7CLE4_TRIWF|nr:peptidyl-tRNA hydrolase ICT1 mitochondrial isoform X1 [Tripterygium wilfordii]